MANVKAGVRRPEILAWLRLARVFQKVDRVSAEGFRCCALSVAQFDILAHVGSDEGTTQQELADSLLVTKGNVCQLLDRMEQAELLERRQDGRANRIFLTSKGRELVNQVVPRQQDLISDLFSVLAPQEQAQLHDLLRKLDRAIPPCPESSKGTVLS